MQSFASSAIFALENYLTILAIQLDRCNDSDFASKVERDMKADFFIRRGRRARRVSMQSFAVFAIFALENYLTILVIQIVRCNDSDFASKAERDMEADFFIRRGRRARRGSMQSFAVFA